MNLLIVYAVLALCSSPATAIWPLPTTFNTGSTTLIIDSSLAFNIGSGSNTLLTDAIARFQVQVSSSTFVWPFKPAATFNPKKYDTLSSVTINVAKPVDAYVDLTPDESYTLTISGTSGSITAAATIGALRALESLRQLVYTTAGSSTTYIANTPITIKDAPQFTYRGVLLDTSRNFFSVADIQRTLDAMAASKLNVFHWHAVDAQSWPLAVDAYPNLTQNAAYGPSMVYSHGDMQQVVKYASDNLYLRQRGILVILEIDMPGHTHALASVFPQIALCMDTQPNWGQVAAEPPSGHLNPTLPVTYTTLNTILASLLPLFPSVYFHTGGDEIQASCWSSLKGTVASLVSEFVTKIHATVRAAGKTPMVWEEIVLDFDVKVGSDTIVQVWQSAANVEKVVQKGYKVVTGTSDYWIISNLCSLHQPLGILTVVTENGWLARLRIAGTCEPFKSWQKIYSFNPIAGLSSSQAKLVFGGEVLLWTEQTDPSNLDRMLWPRAAAAGEVLWSGPGVSTASAAAQRLNEIRFRMVADGIAAEPILPLWCVMNPGHCNLAPDMQ
ncbi:glycoside hydrolase superfamily [Endogone sp. FLAS-F59071]|nr:glycoside hydrolase superfamily [Endogone sp. FLAS-F59071]|eukprot:RUS22059.1 glycoside hydrolase superfamily [Endogone sp. FLAS-F59071]